MSALMSFVDGVMDVVLSPALWLSAAIALVCAVVFYGWRGGGMRQFGRDLVAALLGFGAGQLAGVYFQVDVLRLGQVQLLAGMIGAIAGLFFGRLVWRRGANGR
jgi:hypothetical protein